MRRDRLPKGIPERFFHKRKTETNQRSKAARHIHPVIAIKTVKKGRKDFKAIIVSSRARHQPISCPSILSVPVKTSLRADKEGEVRAKDGR